MKILWLVLKLINANNKQAQIWQAQIIKLINIIQQQITVLCLNIL